MYEPIIGLEIHAQLLTASKMFCACSTASHAAANTQTCPVCLGLPGALPVLNRHAVDLGVAAAGALGCRIEPESMFARKHYFYPDLPKGYQITQYDRPLAVDGRLQWTSHGTRHDVRIGRVHLEEDAGKSLHEGFPGSDGATGLDFNRSGVPLVEIVTAPDLRAAADAAEFFRHLRDLLVAIGASDGNMEEGSLRCDANVSVRLVGDVAFGARTEIKNLNSFRFLQRAIDFEIGRQSGVLRQGGRIEPATLLWDERAAQTVVTRTKEEAHDYRYFPEPDLPPLRLDPARVQRLLAAMPELPDARRARLAARYGLADDDAEFLGGSPALASFFERTAAESGDALAAVHWVKGEVMRRLNETGRRTGDVPLAPAALARLISMVAAGTVSTSAARQIFARMWATGESPETLALDGGLTQESDLDALRALVAETLDRFPEQVAQYRSGRLAVAGFLIGHVMKASGNRANPTLVDQLVRETLDRA